jgi:DNA-directed RNA polymerase specialized sigma subunit
MGVRRVETTAEEAEVPGERPEATVQRAYRFNQDPEWHAFIATYETEIEKIATKYCSRDEFMRDDVRQEARIALLSVFPEEVRGSLDNYCRNVIRNSILSYLDSYSKGNWYDGRTRTVRDAQTGKKRKVHRPARFTSLDALVEDKGMQVDTSGAVSWSDNRRTSPTRGKNVRRWGC